MKPEQMAMGSWTRYASRLDCLPAALRELIRSVQRRSGVLQDQPEQARSLRQLAQQLAGLDLQTSAYETLEAAVSLCLAHGYFHSEGFLAFLYAATFQPLADFGSRLLRRLQARENVETLAVDLVNALFVELTEAVMDREDPFTSSRLPQPGRTLPWLFQALRHDALDHCKSGVNRVELSLVPALEEGYEQALDRLSLGQATLQPVSGFRRMEVLEREQAFRMAFEKATAFLKPRHREVLRLRELANASVEEIADALQLSPQQVQDLLQYGREKRARLILASLRAHPATLDLRDREEELMVLLKRVRLGALSERLREWARPHPSGSAAPRIVQQSSESQVER